MTSLRSGPGRRTEDSEQGSLPAVWLIAALLPLILLGGWLSQFA